MTEEHPGPGPEPGPESEPAPEPGTEALPGVMPKHLAADRAGKGFLRAAHHITLGLNEADVEDDGVVVLRTDGPHRSFGLLESLIDDALAEDERQAREDRHDLGDDDEPGEPGVPRR